MSGVSDIINISVSRETKVPSQAGLSFVNFVSADASFAETIKFYGSQDEIVADALAGADSLQFASEYFAQNPRPIRLYITKKDAGTYVEALDAARVTSDEWYGVAIASRLPADITAVAAWTEPKFKIFMFSIAEAPALIQATATDTLSLIKASAYTRTAGIYHSLAESRFPEAGLFGLQFPKIAGSSTYVYKTIAGLPADNLTSSQKASILFKNGFVYTQRAGINMTEGGKVGSGEWLDVITGIDDLVVDQEARVFGKLINSEKVDMTDAGITVIVGAVFESLNRSQRNGVLAEDPPFKITAPLASEISASNKANRILPDIEWEATLAGAIHTTIIRGRVVL